MYKINHEYKIKRDIVFVFVNGWIAKCSSYSNDNFEGFYYTGMEQ